MRECLNPIGRRRLLFSASAVVGLLTVLGTPPSWSKNLPTGFFVLRTATDTIQKVSKSIAWSRPDIAGVAIRVYWSTIQPTSASEYDWSYVDAVANLAAQNGKQFSICVIGGFNAPSWVYQAGSDGNGAAQFTISGTTQSGVIPAPWDPNFQRRWTTFLQAMGTRYDTMSTLSYVIITGQGWGGQANLCASYTDDTELNNDGGVNVWINAFVSITGLHVSAFPNTPLIVNIGAPVYQGVFDGFKTANNACISAYGTQYGIKNNGLNPNFSTKSWQATEILALSPDHPVGFQMLGASANQSDLITSIKIGQSLGSKLFEVYPNDLKLVSDFNSI